jgi:hypothetical protein
VQCIDAGNGSVKTSLAVHPSVIERFLVRVDFDESKTNYTTAAATAAAVTWRHTIACYVSPTKQLRTVAITVGADWMLAAPSIRKVPLTVGLVRQLVDDSVSSPSPRLLG